MSGVAAEGEFECVEAVAASRLDLLDLAKAGVGAWVVGGQDGIGWEDGSVVVARAEGFDPGLAAVCCGEGNGFVKLAFDAEAVLDSVGGADVGIEEDEVGWDGIEVRAGRDWVSGVLDLNGVEDDTVVKNGVGRKVTAGAVVEETGACAKNGFAFARSIGQRDARGEVVVVRNEGLPIVAETERDLDLRGELDLILDEGSEFVDPVNTTTNSLLRGEDVGSVGGVGRKRGEFDRCRDGWCDRPRRGG